MDEIQKLITAANKTGVEAKCSGCGKTEWVSLGRIVELPLETDDAIDVHRALAIACGRCGLIRLHSTHVLDQYMDPRKD
jgi:ribosomal protein S27AE